MSVEERGVIGLFLYRLTHDVWNRYFTATAIACCLLSEISGRRIRQDDLNVSTRDIVFIIALVFNCISILIIFNCNCTCIKILGTLWVSYRIIDLFSITISHAFFGSRFGKGEISRLERRRAERVIVNTSINYIELMLLYSAIYFYFSNILTPLKFSTTNGLSSFFESLMFSVMNQTTLGLIEIKPANVFALAVVSSQVLIGILLFIQVFSRAVTIATKPQPVETVHPWCDCGDAIDDTLRDRAASTYQIIIVIIFAILLTYFRP